MAARFGVLASGSGGNASVVLDRHSGLLIDAGIGPRVLAARLSRLGTSWSDIHAVLITHTHGDHWKEATLVHLLRRKIPIYCHPNHHGRLMSGFHTYSRLRSENLLRDYADGVAFSPIPGVTCLPMEVSHDSVPTFGFRLDGSPTLFGPGWSVGYLCDLGCYGDSLLDAVKDVDVLALEFNHDVRLERMSGRTRRHIDRVLGDQGHLSNDQAAEALDSHLQRSRAGSLRHVFQLHLSGDCNRPVLAIDAARRVLRERESDARVITAEQDRPTELIEIEGGRSRSAKKRPGPRRVKPSSTFLPGFGDG